MDGTGRGSPVEAGTQWWSGVVHSVAILLILFFLQQEGGRAAPVSTDSGDAFPGPRVPTAPASATGSSSGRDSLVAVSDLLQDIDAYLDLVDEVHGDPFRVASRSEWMTVARELRIRLRSREETHVSRLEAYFVLQELAATLKDGHTYIADPTGQFGSLRDVFPLSLRVIDGRTYVTADWNAGAIPTYSELLAVDSMSITDLRERADRYISAHNREGRDALFGLSLGGYLEPLFGLSPPWRITYRTEGSVREAVIRPVSRAAVSRRRAEASRVKERTMDVGDLRVPVLEIPSFSVGTEADFRRFIAGFFERHRTAPYLVVDLRRNRGGNGYWGFYLLQYLAKSDFQMRASFRFKLSDPLRNSPYIWKIGPGADSLANGTYADATDPATWQVRREGERFEGDVFVLVSELTFSAGAVAAAIFEAHGMGTVVGRETLGRRALNSDPVTVELPRTGFAAILPTAVYALPGEEPDRGIIPHHTVRLDVATLKREGDPDLERVKELIRQRLSGNRDPDDVNSMRADVG